MMMHYLQAKMRKWIEEVFGEGERKNSFSRGNRFMEEAIELYQANGGTAKDAHDLVDYVFGRPIGEFRQEVGGVLLTLAGLCNSRKVNMAECADEDLARVFTPECIARAKAKAATATPGSPLPGHVPDA